MDTTKKHMSHLFKNRLHVQIFIWIPFRSSRLISFGFSAEAIIVLAEMLQLTSEENTSTAAWVYSFSLRICFIFRLGATPVLDDVTCASAPSDDNCLLWTTLFLWPFPCECVFGPGCDAFCFLACSQMLSIAYQSGTALKATFTILAGCRLNQTVRQFEMRFFSLTTLRKMRQMQIFVYRAGYIHDLTI